MRIIVAVKDLARAQAMLPVIDGLGWPRAQTEVRLVHALEAPGGTLGKVLLTASEGEYIAQYLNNQGYIAETMLASLAAEMRQLGYKVETEISKGPAAARIQESSTAFAADLIALALPPKQAWETWIGARVARRLLLEANTSLLICRPPLPGHTLRKAVFATDHSPYADRCVERLIAMAPAGLAEIAVMTAFQSDLVSSLGPFVGQLGLDVSQWVREKLHDENAQVLQQLRAAGYSCSSEVREASVHEAIAATMREQRAGLVIVGAQGHGFVERLTTGSASLHETLYGQSPLLVLRT